MKLDEILIKAYDIIKEEQRNADNKAYIFIGLITLVVSAFGKIPSTGYSPAELSGFLMFVFILLLPLILLVISLIPVYKVKIFLAKKSTDYEELNVFYWRTIIQNRTIKHFTQKYYEKYNIDLDSLNNDLIDQIYQNAKIMSTKASLHEFAFNILVHILIFLFSSIWTIALSSSNTLMFFIVFVVIELLYNFLPFFNNKKKKKKVA